MALWWIIRHGPEGKAITEQSFLWTTSGSPSGDQVSGYTQAHWATIMGIVGCCSGFEGVAPSYLNELNPAATGANTVQIPTGGALVDGKPYLNDAAVDVNIPSAVGGGNTRIDRIVLRASWAAFTVRITRIAGTDAAVPTAPAITQTSGTTYDIMICQVLVDTSGACTVTKERVWGMVAVDNTTLNNDTGTLQVKALGVDAAQIAANAVIEAKIANGAVTEDKLATNAVTADKIAAGAVGSSEIATGAVDSAELAADAVIAGKIADGAVDTTATLANDIVDDTKVGNRVPFLYRRQGGSSTHWATSGNTTYTPGAVMMQAGTKEWTGSAAANGSVSITFPVSFSYYPVVFCMCTGGAPTDRLVVWQEGAPSASGVNLRWADISATTHTSVEIYWLAIGPE